VYEPHAELKYAKLQRMQWLATALLGAMLILLGVSVGFKTAYPWLQWLQAFAEAATVGAVADWFAVVALFHHPLGLPIPHTAIIPRNKDRIGESLGRFVEYNFLTPQNIVKKLAQRNLAKIVAQWLADRANSEDLAERVCVLVPAMLNALDDEDVRRFVDRTITPLLDRLDVARIAGNILTVLTVENRHQALLDRALIALEEWITANRGLIETKFSEASRYTPSFVDAYIVNKFAAGVIALLHEVAHNLDHEIRRQFDQATEQFIHDLKTSPQYREQGELLKHDFIEHIKREEYYRVVWSDVRERLTADLANEPSLVRANVAEALVKLASGLRDDAALQAKLNGWLMKAVEALLLQHRHQVSRLITDVVKGWDAREVGEKIELEVGSDLQYIRINGTLVGGIVGVLLHVATGFV